MSAVWKFIVGMGKQERRETQVDTADTVFIGNPESVDGGSRHLCQSLEKERT